MADSWIPAAEMAEIERMMGETMQPDSGPPPAAQLFLSGLPDVVIAEEHVSQSIACAVCLEQFGVGDDAKRMPCAHIFHDMCLIEWLQRRNSCPSCRYELPTLDLDYEEQRSKKEVEEGSRLEPPSTSLMYS